MANPPPLPPIVSGPVYSISKQVFVSNVLPHSTVTVYNDPASTNVVGTATSTSPGSIWVLLATTLAHGQPITARQKYTGSDPKIQVTGLSPPSALPVPVLLPPTPLPAPVFASGLCTCMDWVYIDGLIAGATLTIKMGATTMVGAAIVTQTPQWFQLAAHPIPAGSVLEAHQNVGAATSPVTPSNPIPEAPALGAPVIAPIPLDCQTNMNLSNVQPGADLKITKGSTEYFATNPSSSYNLFDLAPPLQTGSWSAQQYFTRCKEQRPATQPFTVKKQAPKTPNVSYAPCADVTLLNVSDVVGGEILTLEVHYSTTTGPVQQSLGQCGVSGPGPVPLPKGWYPSMAVGPVTLLIGALLCDDPSSGLTSVSVEQPPGPYPPPTVQKPLYDCATSVFVQEANPGCLIQVFAEGSPPLPRSNPMVATTANFPVKLWSPLITNERIYVQQLGCGASAAPAAAVRVQPRPALPVPTVAGSYVLTTATSVLVNEVVPGAQVTLFVNGHARNAPVDSIEAEAGPPTGSPPRIQVSLPVGWPPLAPGDVLTAGQALCGLNKLPPREGGGVAAQKPLPAPSPGPAEPRGGLGSNNNYFMFAPVAGGGCANLLNVSVTLSVQQAIVWASTGPSTPPGGYAPPGFSLQVNCYSLVPSSPTPKYPLIQQYIVNLWGTQLLGAINTWTGPTSPVILPSGNEFTLPLGPSLPSTAIPAGYNLTITLGNDPSGNVNSVSWVVNGTAYPPSPQSIPALLTANGLSATDIGPIVGFTVGLVGPVNAESAVLTSGSGKITYSASSPLTVSNAEPLQCGAVSTSFTLETATTSYGVLPANPGNPFSQSFAASAITPLIRRSVGLHLSRVP
jgi:hypothetical protein